MLQIRLFFVALGFLLAGCTRSIPASTYEPLREAFARYEAEEAARLCGLLAAHELGHQLLHLGHPWGNPACLMYPVPMLAYRATAATLAPARCALGSEPAMTPGAIKSGF